MNWVLELDRGRYYIYESNYSGYLEKKAKRLEQEEREEQGKQKAIKDELDWIRRSPKARQAKSKARIRAFDELVEAQENRTPGKAQILIQVPERLGGNVIEVKGADQGLWRQIAVRGSELLAAARRHRRRDRPQRRRQDHLVQADHRRGAARRRRDQDRRRPSISAMSTSRATRSIPNKNVWEEISGGSDVFRFGKHEIGTRAYVGAFNFKGPDQQKKVGQLSGGERNRVHMAKMLKEGGNVLLLDEPTNDLDVETLRALEEALENFAGCAVIISHDRFFLDRLATHILAFEGDSHVEWFEGNFEAYEEDKRRRLGPEADRPHRMTYRKLTR